MHSIHSNNSISISNITSRHTPSSLQTRAILEAAETYMKGILEYTSDPIVSVDVIGNTHSAVFDSK